MIGKILDQKNLIIMNNKCSYNSAEIVRRTKKIIDILERQSIRSKLVALYVNDSILQFFLTIALWKCECNIMYVNTLNGLEYCNKIFNTYMPDYIIGEEMKSFDNEEIYGNFSYERFIILDKKLYICKTNQSKINLKNKRGMIFFTSGTTAVPKAIFRSEKNIMNDAMSNILSFEIDKTDKVLFTVPYGHVYGLGSGVIPYAMRGATIYFVPYLLSGRTLKRIIEEKHISIIIGSPAIYQELLNTNVNLEEVRLILSAGSKISMSLFDEFYFKFGKEINNMYGSSETGAISTLYNHNRFDGDSSNCGKPMKTITVKCNGTREVNDKIYVKSDSIAEGYIEYEQLHPLVNKDGWYATNDMGYFDEEGELHICCRKNEIINIGGEKISPKVVEEIFERYYGETVVTTEMGVNGFEYPVAYIQTEKYQFSNIRNELEKKLSKRFIPKKVYVVKRFPRNINGKIKKDELIYMDKDEYSI